MTQLVWLVTGCSSGFGEAFVHSILARGDKIIATARNVSKLESLRAIGAQILQLDITASQEQLDNCVKDALAIYGHIDVLVNNAGYTELGTIVEMMYDRWLAQLYTNLFGTINITRSLMPNFREKKSGVVIFIGSMSGWKGDPVSGAYCSSKAALELAVESFQAETESVGIKSLIVEPGLFRTALLSPDHIKSVDSKFEEYKPLSNAVIGGVKGYSGQQQGDPHKAVEIIIDIVKKEGKSAGKGFPAKLPLGADAVAQMRKKCTDVLKLLDDWEEISSSTGFSPGT
ncbi:putative oxidoreductase YusZ [Coleophoma crateriformis]|uniref:Putative oxidoreductase YusZ n=1 Tax=Coleophoma crateriformis TaxID=565419 RepID=A0A3D8T133_9HELO|nr:putative oxidoreductase YusZ [Coleophoma crateriformis]